MAFAPSLPMSLATEEKEKETDTTKNKNGEKKDIEKDRNKIIVKKRTIREWWFIQRKFKFVIVLLFSIPLPIAFAPSTPMLFPKKMRNKEKTASYSKLAKTKNENRKEHKEKER